MSKQQPAPDAVAEVGAGMVVDDVDSIRQIISDFNSRFDRARNVAAAAAAAAADADDDAVPAPDELPRRVPVGRENLNQPLHPNFSPVESNDLPWHPRTLGETDFHYINAFTPVWSSDVVAFRCDLEGHSAPIVFLASKDKAPSKSNVTSHMKTYHSQAQQDFVLSSTDVVRLRQMRDEGILRFGAMNAGRGVTPVKSIGPQQACNRELWSNGQACACAQEQGYRTDEPRDSYLMSGICSKR